MTKALLRAATTAIIVCAWLTACDSERYDAEEKFAKALKQLKPALDDLTRAPAKTEPAAQPYIKGKIAVFARSKGTVPPGYSPSMFFFRELNDVHAAKPDEVGTVALVDCEGKERGTYKTKDGKEYPAKVEDCELTIIDRSKTAVVFRKMFQKTPSENYKVYKDSVVQQSSQVDIAAFLKGLPRT